MDTLNTQLSEIRADIKKHEDELEGLRHFEEKIIQTIEKMKADERQTIEKADDERQKAMSENDTRPTGTVTKIDKTISQWGGDERNGWDLAYGVEKGKEYTFKVMEGFNPELGGLYGWGNYIVRYGTLITGTVDKIDNNLVFFSLDDVKINAKKNPDITTIDIPINVLEHVDEDKRGIHISSSDFNRQNRIKQKHFSAEEFNKKISYVDDVATKVSMIEVGETYHIVLKNGDTVKGKVLNADGTGEISIEGQRKVYAEDIQTITKIEGFMFRSKVKRSAKRYSKRSAKRSVKKVKRSIARKTKRSTKKGKTRS